MASPFLWAGARFLLNRAMARLYYLMGKARFNGYAI
jgi:hypothetical protein